LEFVFDHLGPFRFIQVRFAYRRLSGSIAAYRAISGLWNGGNGHSGDQNRISDAISAPEQRFSGHFTRFYVEFRYFWPVLTTGRAVSGQN
jgi:hypothetical protein